MGSIINVVGNGNRAWIGEKEAVVEGAALHPRWCQHQLLHQCFKELLADGFQCEVQHWVTAVPVSLARACDTLDREGWIRYLRQPSHSCRRVGSGSFGPQQPSG